MAQLLAAPGGVEISTAASATISHALPSSSGPSAGIPSSCTVALQTKHVQHHLAAGKGKGRADTPFAHVKEPATGLEATDLRGLVNLTNKQRAFLLKAGFTTTAEVLYTPLRPLSEKLRLPEHDTRELVRTIVDERKARWITGESSKSVAERLRALSVAADPADDLKLVEPPTLYFGDEGFRDLLGGGGLVPGTLTEVAGEASSGKTAFSLQLSLRVQLPISSGGLDGSCAYLSSEGNFPSIRLRDMAFKLSDGTPEGVKQFMDNVNLVHSPEVDELLHVVRYSLPAMVAQSYTPTSTSGERREQSGTARKPVKLVVVDSIAAPFRGSEGGGKNTAATEGGEAKSANSSLQERNTQLAEISFRLRKLARQFSLVVVLVNQVSDVFHKDDNSRFAVGSSQYQAYPSSQAGQVGGSVTHENGGIPLEYRNLKHASQFFSGEEAEKQRNGGKVATFGLTWANCIDTRIMLSRTGRRRRKLDGTEVIQLHVLRDESGMEIEDPVFALETEEIRRATLVFSPYADKGYVDYSLRQEGLVSVGKYHHTPRGGKPAKKKKVGKKGKVMAMHSGGNGKGASDSESEEEQEDEEEALWADMPIDEATLSQL